MKFLTHNPYDYNSVLNSRKRNDVPYNPTAFQAISDPTTNFIGKFLGIDTKKEWNQYYDKVVDIVRYAKGKAVGKDTKDILDVVINLINTSPSMHLRKIDDVWMAQKLDLLVEPAVDENGNATKDDKVEKKEKPKAEESIEKEVSE